MKNLLKIFVVVAGMAAALYSCEPKQSAENKAEDSTLTTPAPDSLAAPTGDSSAVKTDSANAGK